MKAPKYIEPPLIAWERDRYLFKIRLMELHKSKLKRIVDKSVDANNVDASGKYLKFAQENYKSKILKSIDNLKKLQQSNLIIVKKLTSITTVIESLVEITICEHT